MNTEAKRYIETQIMYYTQVKFSVNDIISVSSFFAFPTPTPFSPTATALSNRCNSIASFTNVNALIH